ncbi:hypothetical protein V2P20_03710 [Methylobacter sp. Wu1]|uniref:hypothetical protein n=1 Tax=Methylobacter sp. Wu1 TaxID=3119359 RepID=UPI002F9275A1
MLLLFANLQSSAPVIPPAANTPPLPHGVYGVASLTSRHKSIQHQGTRLEETVYLGHDNTIELVLSVDGQAINRTLITRLQLAMGATVLDSDTAPALFDLTRADRLVMELGGAGLAAGRHAAALIIYDAGDPNGLVWGDLVLVVKP